MIFVDKCPNFLWRKTMQVPSPNIVKITAKFDNFNLPT